MNDVEDRLRDALAARAVTKPDPGAYDAIVARRARRRLRSWATLGAAVVATAAVVAVITTSAPRTVVAPPASTPTGTATAPSAPAAARAIAIVGDGVRLVVTDGVGGGLDGTTMPGRIPTGVAAVGDGEQFFVAFGSATGCESVLSRPLASLDTMEGQGVTQLVGHTARIAISRDARLLAYVTSTGPSCDRTELRVRDLASGHERVWTTSAERDAVTSLSWAPDLRHVTMVVNRSQVTVLDTGAAEGDLGATPPLRLPIVDVGLTCRYVATAYRGDVLTAVRHCSDDSGTTDKQTVVEVHGESAGDVVFGLAPGDEAAALSWSGTGHALVTLGEPPDAAVQRWDGAGDALPYDTGYPDAYLLAW